MHYEIWDFKGNVLVTTDDWSNLMTAYKKVRKEQSEAVTLHKIEDEEEV